MTQGATPPEGGPAPRRRRARSRAWPVLHARARWTTSSLPTAALTAAATLFAGVVLSTASPAQAETGAMIVPVNGSVTSIVGSGCPGSRPGHAGIDLATSIGTPVYAAYAGTARRRSDPSGYGLYLNVDHTNGYQTRYAHLDRYTVPEGAQVAKGQLIAYSGNTGGSTGPHLHFEVRISGSAQSGINSHFPCGSRHTSGTPIGWTFPGLPANASGPAPTFSPKETINDVSGDGYADLLAIDAAGGLLYYPNNMNSNTNGLPYTSGQQIGSGWGVFNRTFSVDVTRDGHAEVLAIDADGRLWMFPNNINSNAGGLPYTSGTVIGSGWFGFDEVLGSDVDGDGWGDLLATRTDGTLWWYRHTGDGSAVAFTARQIGDGWNRFTTIRAADISGDAHADILAVNATGELYYYPNNMDTNAGNLPFTGGSLIGSGWQGFDRIVAADVSGDGHADVLATTPAGSLLYYPNNMDTNAGGLPFTSGSQIGSGWAPLVIVGS